MYLQIKLSPWIKTRFSMDMFLVIFTKIRHFSNLFLKGILVNLKKSQYDLFLLNDNAKFPRRSEWRLPTESFWGLGFEYSQGKIYFLYLSNLRVTYSLISYNFGKFHSLNYLDQLNADRYTSLSMRLSIVYQKGATIFSITRFVGVFPNTRIKGIVLTILV